MGLIMGFVSTLLSTPFRLLVAWSDAIDDVWDLDDPFLTS